MNVNKNISCYHFKNKAGYTATEVACGWAGDLFEVTRPFGQEWWGQKSKTNKKSKMGTDQPTDRPTDGRTKWGVARD